MARYRNSIRNLPLPTHVKLLSNGTFYYRCTFPPILRYIIGKWEYKCNLGVSYERAQILAYRLNTQIKLMQREAKKVCAKNNISELDLMRLYRSFKDSGGSDELPLLTQFLPRKQAYSLLNNTLGNLDILFDETEVDDMASMRIGDELRRRAEEFDAKVKNGGNSAPEQTLAQALNEWKKQKISEGVAASTVKSLDTTIKEILWFFGADAGFSDINDHRMKQYVQYWKGDIPPLDYRMPKSGVKVPVKKILDGDYDKSSRQSRPVSAKYKKGMLMWVKGVFAWMTRSPRKYIPKDYLDYFDDIKIVQQASSQTKKRAFKEEEIQKICENIERYKSLEKTAKKDTRWRYWIFYIMLYTGARPNEISQLFVSDVLYPGDIDPNDRSGETKLSLHCFYIIDEEADSIEDKKGKKSVKKGTSRRLIPIHSELIRRGFLDYVADRKAHGYERLFDLTWAQSNGFASRSVKWYNDIIRALYPDNVKMGISLYSARHNVETQFDRKLTNIQERNIGLRITGRKAQYMNDVVGVYIDAYTPEEMHPIIEKIRYDVLQYPRPQYNEEEDKFEDL